MKNSWFLESSIEASSDDSRIEQWNYFDLRCYFKPSSSQYLQSSPSHIYTYSINASDGLRGIFWWHLLLWILYGALNLKPYLWEQPLTRQCFHVSGLSYQQSLGFLYLPLGNFILSALTANLTLFQSGSFVGSVCLSNYAESSYYSSLSSSTSSSSDGCYFWRVFSWDILDLDCFSGSSSSDESEKRLTWFMAAWFTLLNGESLRSDGSDYFNSFYSSS